MRISVNFYLNFGILIGILLGCGGRTKSSSNHLFSAQIGSIEHPQPTRLLTASTPVSISASEMGYAGSALQIDTLPAGNQFTPKLALTYSSSMTEVGIAGLGWSLAGFSSISRCASQKLFDGISKGIDWTSSDSWCMDGKKLLLVSGTAGIDGAEYRFFLDDMSKILFKSGHFEVMKKSGERLVFGETEASREDGQNKAFLSYHLNRLLDRSGNAIDYAYAKDGGRLFLDQVQYGGNVDFNKPHYRTISFQYEKPEVSVARYAAGQKYGADRLLKSIAVGNGKKVSWTYRLHHERKTPAALPILVAVDQCFKDLECTPKTTFEYDLPDTISVSESPQFIWPEFGTQSSLTWAPDKSARAFVDLNGDGYPDILGITKDAINFSLSGSKGPGPIVTQKRTDLTNWNPLVDMFAVADMDKDGFVDLILFTSFAPTAGTYIAYGNGDGFEDFKLITPAFGKKWFVDLTIRSVVDVNGDGWPDIIGSSNDGIFVAFNDKSGGLIGGTEPLTKSFTWGGWIGRSSPRYFIDVNGDGLVDILGLGTKGVMVSLGTGTGFKEAELWSPHFLTKDYPDSSHYRHVADMNGDGLPDIVGFGLHNVEVALNTGHAFTEPVVWLDNLAYSKGWDKFRSERFLLDVNKDGYPDLIGFQQKGVEIYLNKGVPNPAQQAIKVPAFNYVRLKSWDSSVTSLQLDDLDADGKIDMFLMLKEGVWKSQIESKPTKLIAVKTALGEETRITYKSLMDRAVYTATTTTSPVKTILQGPLEVVAEIKKSNGLGGFFSTRYSYENGAYDSQALGFLGFEKRHIFDDSAGTEAIETYSQDTRRMTHGTLIATEIYLNRSGNCTILSRGATEIGIVDLGIHPLHKALFEKSSRSIFYDELGREIYSVAVSKEFDSYQNTTAVTTTLSDAKGTHITKADTKYRNDQDRWVIGLPERVTTTATSSTAPGQSSVKISAFDYDASGLLTSETMEPDSRLWIKKEYPRTKNRFGLVDSVITSWGPAHSKGLDFTSMASSLDFDSFGFVTTSTNALGHQKSQTIDPQTGLTLTTTDENGIVTRVFYDAANRPEVYEYADGQRVGIERLMCDEGCPVGAIMYQRQTSNRDGTGVVYIDSMGRTIRSVQSLAGEQKVGKDKVYNEMGLLVRESKPYFLGDGPSQWMSYSYDARNRQNLITMPDGAQSNVIHDGLTTTSIDPLGRSTISIQDSRGLLQTMTNPKGEVLSYAYDASGQLRELRDAGGNVTRMEYDVYGRRTLLDDPSTGISSTEYNALSQAFEHIRQGRKTTHTYDALGRTLSTERSAPGTPSISENYVYDSARYGIGQLAEARGPDSSVKLSYDALSRPLESTEKLLGQSYTKLSSYDALGRIQTHTYPGGVTIGYDYDSVGQVKSIRDKQSNKVLWNLESLYPNGDVKEYTLGNGSRGFKQQNVKTDRIESETVRAPDQTLQMARGYDHDLVGNLKTRTDGLTGKTDAFTYDPLDRLETFVGPAFKTVTMRYDQLSRITERSDVGTYEYGVGCAGAFNSPFAPKKVGGKSYCTHARGNVISAGDRTLSYDANNLPTEMRQGGNSVRYNYGIGRSVLSKDETIDGERTQTRFVGEEFEIVEAGGTTKQRSYVGDFLVIETEGSEYRENYLYKDYFGSTLAAADQNAAIIERMDYDPFGQRRNVEDLSWLEAGSFKAKTTSRGFTGHDQIDSMNLVHMKGRVYDPTIGLFLTPDPYVQNPRMTQNLNRYSYVLNNPLRYTDPTGHFFEGIGREINRALKTGGNALRNPGAFLQNTWDKAGRGLSDPRYLRLAASIAISVVATVNCPIGADAAWYQTAAYYAAVGATSSYVASNGDQKAALNGAYTGAAFNMVGSYFQFASGGKELSSSMLAAKIAAHGVVGGLSAQSQGGSFESGFLSAGLSEFAGQQGLYGDANGKGGQIAQGAATAAIVGGTISAMTGGNFESGALNAAIGRLFNEYAHRLTTQGGVTADVTVHINDGNPNEPCMIKDVLQTNIKLIGEGGLVADYTIENSFSFARIAKATIGFGLAAYESYGSMNLLRGAEPVGSALKGDLVHSSATWIRNSAAEFRVTGIVGKDGSSYKLYQTIGELNGKSGRFEFIVNPQTKQLTHQMFVRGGNLNGVPIKP